MMKVSARSRLTEGERAGEEEKASKSNMCCWSWKAPIDRREYWATHYKMEDLGKVGMFIDLLSLSLSSYSVLIIAGSHQLMDETSSPVFL